MENETRRVFEIYTAQVEHIRNYYFEDHVKTIGLGFSATKREDGLWHWTFGLPDDKERDAFLLVFRTFIQQNDEVCILNLNRFHKDPDVSKEWKEGYSEARQIFLKFLHEKPVEIEDDVFYGSPTREKILDTVLYGKLAHVPRDRPEKRELFLKWTENEFWEMILFQEFTRILLGVLQVVYRIDALCRLEIQKNT